MVSKPAQPPSEADVLSTIRRIAQKCLESFPVLILGSGASAQYGIRGMRELGTHLSSTIKPVTVSDKDSWTQFEHALSETRDLELALQRVLLPEALHAQVIRETRACIFSDDWAVFGRVAARQQDLALARIYKHLLRSTHPTLAVITTNYDRVAEYAADAARLSWFTGFSRGYLGFFGQRNNTRQPPPGEHRTVEIWKVHGSVDWFADADGISVALPYGDEFPKSFTPLLVTPGVSKFETTHQEPFRTIIGNADMALAQARSFLCVGYGFNDTHIQPKLVERVRDHDTPIVILTRTMRQPARDFLSRCKRAPFLALEQVGTSTRAYFSELSDGHEVANSDLWKLDTFLDTTIGTI